MCIAGQVAACSLLLAILMTLAFAQLPKEDLYYELARQARERLVQTKPSASHFSAQFRSLVFKGFKSNGYTAEEVKV